jgi:N-acetylmuramoyl-L-alanine amidase
MGRPGEGFAAARWIVSAKLAVGALLVLVAVAAALPAGADADRFDTVVIDSGHGGDDEGARGSGGMLEKDLVLDVGQRVAQQLREAGLKVVLTRSEDRFVGLEERTSVANDARADLFVSIHANGSRARLARGVETYFAALEASDETSAELARAENEAFGAAGVVPAPSDDPLVAILGDMIATEHLNDSQEFARLAQHALAADGARSRGVKQAPFVVLMGVQMPAALVEIGFITNARDERAFGTPAQRARIAGDLGRAILEFGRRFDARRGPSAAAAPERSSGEKF